MVVIHYNHVYPEITKSRPKYRGNHLEPASPDRRDDRRRRDDRDRRKC